MRKTLIVAAVVAVVAAFSSIGVLLAQSGPTKGTDPLTWTEAERLKAFPPPTSIGLPPRPPDIKEL